MLSTYSATQLTGMTYYSNGSFTEYYKSHRFTTALTDKWLVDWFPVSTARVNLHNRKRDDGYRDGQCKCLLFVPRFLKTNFTKIVKTIILQHTASVVSLYYYTIFNSSGKRQSDRTTRRLPSAFA
jgi:hypothetical protein